MEKYARQALQEGVKDERELLVNDDHELYRVLNVHYNRNNHIEVSLIAKIMNNVFIDTNVESTSKIIINTNLMFSNCNELRTL